jgi:hypothetical protein
MRWAAVGGPALIMTILAYAYWYQLSFVSTASALTREALLRSVLLAIDVYDPYQPRLAVLGPADQPDVHSKEYVRIEDLFSSAASTGLPDRRMHLQRVHNERIVRSRYQFSYQPYDEPRLQALRDAYRLDEVVAGATDEFHAMILLRNWTRSQFRRRDYQPRVANFDALAVLDRRLRNTTGEPYDPARHFNPCHFFPLLYSQIMLSMGYQARLVSITHGMTEVWSNQYRKWVTMDAELNLHYEKDGIPLNMAEMRDEHYVRQPSTVQIVRGTQSSDANTTLVHLGVADLAVEGMIDYHFRPLDIVDMRNDWLTNHYFPGHPKRSELNSLTYLDPGNEVSRPLAARLRPVTTTRDDVYWTLNQTEIWIQTPRTDVLPISFRTVTPNFRSFEIIVDESRPRQQTASRFAWRLHTGANVLTVRTVNQFGIPGPTSSVTIYRDPISIYRDPG